MDIVLSDVSNYSSKLICWAFWMILLSVTSDLAIAQNADDKLAKALVSIQFGTNLSVIEAEGATLLQQNTNSPETLGKIYLSLALNSEYQREHNLQKMIENSQKALQYPLNVRDACSAYDCLGGAMRRKMEMSGNAFSPRQNEREETVMRRQVLDVYLNALKLIFSKTTTLQKQKVPGVTMLDAVTVVALTNATQSLEEREKIDAMNRTSAQMYQKMRQEWQAQMKAHDEAVAANDLVDQYNWFKRDVIDLYRGIPFVDEITEEGAKVASGDPKLMVLTKELVEEIKTANAPRATSETNLIK